VPSGGGGAGGAAPAAGGAPAAAAAEEKKEEKEEEKVSCLLSLSFPCCQLTFAGIQEESDEDMGFGLFD